ncbi:hypothetical protein [Natrialba aegyptia]|nr:hypothetical protein [Natrialba aegyptia]
MQQRPRRAVLGGIGATMITALSGSTVATTESERTPVASTTTESSFDDVLAYLPAAVADDSMVVTAVDYDRLLEADQPHDPRPSIGSLDIDAESVSKSAFVTSYTDEFSQPLRVLVTDSELEAETETRESDAGIEYEFTAHDSREETVVGTDGDVLVVATDAETVDAAFDAKAGEGDRLLESASTVEDGLTVFDGSDARTVQVGDEQMAPRDVEDAAVEYVVRAQTVLDRDTMEVSIGIQFEDESAVTDELIETLEAEFAYTATADEPAVEVDGAFVSTTVERDLAAERAVREHDSPGSLHVDREIDLDDEYLEIELLRGDPTPIEDVTFEVDGEEYDRDIWTNGHGKLEAGDTIVMDMDDVEPNLSISLSHDHALGSSSSGTSILSHFRFESEFDVDTGELVVTYDDDFPLDGDRVHLAVYEDRPYYRPDEEAPEPRTSAQPWTGETLSEGDRATLDGVESGDTVLVGWDGTAYDDSISRVQARPPGHVSFEYDYDSERLEAVLEFDSRRPASETDEAEASDIERSASEYELLIDGEPADTQWTDEFETVSSGATIELTDVPIGVDVEAVWAATETQIGWTQPQPSVELEYDAGTIEHVGGDELSAAELTAEVWTDEDRFEIELGDEIDGDFEEGETFTVDAGTEADSDDELGEVYHVSIRYAGEYQVGYAYPNR